MRRGQRVCFCSSKWFIILEKNHPLSNTLDSFFFFKERQTAAFSTSFACVWSRSLTSLHPPTDRPESLLNVLAQGAATSRPTSWEPSSATGKANLTSESSQYNSRKFYPIEQDSITKKDSNRNATLAQYWKCITAEQGLFESKHPVPNPQALWPVTPGLVLACSPPLKVWGCSFLHQRAGCLPWGKPSPESL